ncbi:hypothetical protein [Actinomyces gaoshouyii]|uniref:hypothetical protein n=1 Tax=Actinomyces gaoshouyii TaxID=1960083 RepID=UPI0009BD9B99|nr:hypothetical protein [Actinomyces gaoshouyii]ARD42516.1 hypothetical protein B6G06_09315 [Actinomyces gaoshouyii]
MTTLVGRRGLLNTVSLTAVALVLAGCGEDTQPSQVPGGRAAGTEPTTAMTPTVSASATSPTVVETNVDMAPARTVAVALATGNQSEVDVAQYLTGEAVTQAEQIIAAGREANDRTLARFGTVHHAVTLDELERSERSEVNGVTMLTVVTFGWDAPPDDSEVTQAARVHMTAGGPGTLAWYLTLDESTGLIDGIWTSEELGSFD